jgi:hypothetical protein
MVKSDPATPWWGVIAVMTGLMALFNLVEIVFLAVSITSFGDIISITYGSVMFSPLIFIMNASIYFAIFINLLRQERHRQAAAATSLQQRMALVGQSMPALPPLSMPFTLRLRPNWRFCAILYGPFLLILVGISIAGTIVLQSSYLDITTALIISLFPFLLLAPIIALTVFTLRQRIEVNDYGITVYRGLQKTTSLYWETVVLFAQIRAIPIQRDPRRTAAYELSNAQTLTRFMVPRTRWSPMLPQYMSLADYDRQMALLMQYIAVRTGLQLIDVR